VIDIWSVLLATAVLSLVFLLLSLFTWVTAKGKMPGPGHWLAGFCMLAAGVVLVALRGNIPDLISIVIANSLIVAGVMLKTIGFMLFLDIRSRTVPPALIVLFALTSVLLYVFLVPFPSLKARMFVTSFAYFIYGVVTAYYLICQAPAGLKTYARMASGLFIAYSGIYGFRAVKALSWSAGERWLDSGDATESYIMVAVVTLLAGIAVIEMQLMQGRLRMSLESASVEMAKSNAALTDEILRRTLAENQLLAINRELSSTQKEIMITLSEVVEFRSKETALHVARVGEYARVLARAKGLPPEEVEMIADAAPMHDIGKISISDNILNKPAGLSEAEMTIMRGHTLVGYGMLNKSERPLIRTAAVIALEHHEYWNGSGYPHGKSGEGISFAGRAVCLCDVFDALSSRRPYKDPWELPRILKFLRAERGRMFDPGLIDSMFANLDEFLSIADSLKDEDAPSAAQPFRDRDLTVETPDR